MSNIALGEDKKFHYADRFALDPYSGAYLCPGCGVAMILKNIGPASKDIKATAPYFSAIPSSKHMAGCAYDAGGLLGTLINADGFSFEELFDHITKPGGVVQKQPGGNESSSNNADVKINTLGKFFAFCRTHDMDFVFPDGTTLWHVFQDERSEGLPYSQRKPRRAIMLNFINCNFKWNRHTDSYNIWCLRPHTETVKPPAYDGILRFGKKHLNIMHEWCEVLSPLKNKLGDAPLIIIVMGEWDGKCCEIIAKRQIYLVSHIQS